MLQNAQKRLKKKKETPLFVSYSTERRLKEEFNTPCDVLVSIRPQQTNSLNKFKAGLKIHGKEMCYYYP